MRMYVGIDPGINGGICFLNRQGIIENVMPMPKPTELAVIFSKSLSSIQHLCIEKAHSVSKQGIIGTFNYGVGFGILQGICIAYNINYSLIPPRTWQKQMIIKTRLRKPKDKALASANKVFKKKNDFWLRTKRCSVPHDGMIDSALIAEYCRLHVNQQEN